MGLRGDMVNLVLFLLLLSISPRFTYLHILSYGTAHLGLNTLSLKTKLFTSSTAKGLMARRDLLRIYAACKLPLET